MCIFDEKELTILIFRHVPENAPRMTQEELDDLVTFSFSTNLFGVIIWSALCHCECAIYHWDADFPQIKDELNAKAEKEKQGSRSRSRSRSRLFYYIGISPIDKILLNPGAGGEAEAGAGVGAGVGVEEKAE